MYSPLVRAGRSKVPSVLVTVPAMRLLDDASSAITTAPKTAEPFIVTVAGLKLQVASAGSPEQPKLACPFIPAKGLVVMVKVADCPARMLAVLGDTVSA